MSQRERDGAGLHSGLLSRLSQPLQMAVLQCVSLSDAAEVSLVSKSARVLCESFFASLHHFNFAAWSGHAVVMPLVLRCCTNLRFIAGFPLTAELGPWQLVDGQEQKRPSKEARIAHLLRRNRGSLRSVPNCELSLATLRLCLDLPNLERLPAAWSRVTTKRTGSLAAFKAAAEAAAAEADTRRRVLLDIASRCSERLHRIALSCSDGVATPPFIERLLQTPRTPHV